MNPIIKNLGLLLLSNQYALSRKMDSIRRANVLTILNLHRVSDDDSSAYEPLSPDLFVELLVFLRKRFEITTFADLDADRSYKKPPLILSFDDGYKDFIEVAVPILEKYRIKVNQNIIPECIERQQPPLNLIAQDFIGKAPLSLRAKLEVPGLQTSDVVGDPARMGLRISRFIKNQPIHSQQKLAEAIMPQFYGYDEFRPTSMMSREDVRQLLGVHEIGVHSYAHASMQYESDDYFQKDLANCRRYFLEVLGGPVNIYAFPNDSYRDGQVSRALEAGFARVLLVGDSFSRSDTWVHHRFGFHAGSKREAFFRAVGGVTQP
jgi:peptidoglycan/xylan/chitin deacetylase (PgdA/CDA1 family)